MPTAEIIAIGTELLLGEIQDTNTSYLARQLREIGIDMYRATLIGDNAERISRVIQESLERCQIVITTGGLGPTVDDPTRQAVALAMNTALDFIPELWDQIQNRFKRYNRQATENNKRQAYIPKCAVPIENAVGTAPAFLVDTGEKVVISLPGVPREMEYLVQNHVLPFLKKRFDIAGTIKAYVLHTGGVGESQIDEWIGDLETVHNPTVGLLAHAGQVDIRITAKAKSVEEADQMIEEMAAKIRERVGDAIWGVNQDTLAGIVQKHLSGQNLPYGIVECGFQGQLHQVFHQGLHHNKPTLQVEACSLEELRDQVTALAKAENLQFVIGASLQPDPVQQTLNILMMTPEKVYETIRSYGGPPAMGISWAINLTLDFIRRHLK